LRTVFTFDNHCIPILSFWTIVNYGPVFPGFLAKSS
jgi:hypothetical protein